MPNAHSLHIEEEQELPGAKEGKEKVLEKEKAGDIVLTAMYFWCIFIENALALHAYM